ncbi:chaperone NapD [Mesorhizobium sp. L48C026A00]|uniref:chaperone NapD n=1 Tax=Mesorhizobium sp. L48C026A00 TaxID=1287182 RepID=UPI0003CFB8D9|nr:chaperone NapD [Mesorhizobium sp. L48C026A00]ESZ20082.1 glutamate synthase subunit beta [Mesorhizobium sp. L48C026A00]
MRENPAITRRSLLKGGFQARHHISSAVVVVLPARREELSRRLAEMPGVEIHAGEGSRIVVTIEGPGSGMLGETLTTISMMDGVIAANMVFEHIERREDESK